MRESDKYHTLTLSDGKKVNLTKKRNEFARIYALTGDATNSRLKAGYSDIPKYNKQEAYGLLQNEDVQDAVEFYKGYERRSFRDRALCNSISRIIIYFDFMLYWCKMVVRLGLSFKYIR